MPYKLVQPKAGRSAFWRVRGTEYGIRIDRTTATGDKKAATKFLALWRDEAQRHALSAQGRPTPLTFARAALAYVRAGGEECFLKPLALHFGDKIVADIGQSDIDEAAVALFPNSPASTRNRCVYTPLSAIFRHAGVVKAIRRPVGALARPRAHWLRPAQAFALLSAAASVNVRFGALLTFLLYCGPRLSEALRLEWDDVDFERSTALLRTTKNGQPMTLHMPPEVVAAIANLPRGRRVFATAKCGRLYAWLTEAERRAGVVLPPRAAFHVLRHTHATWRRLYTGADTSALVASGLWKSRNAAAIYEHIDVSEEARKTDLFPTAARVEK